MAKAPRLPKMPKKPPLRSAAGRAVRAEVLPAKSGLVLRNMAATDYITDPDGRSVRYHYERPDRNYRVVAWATFREWSTADDWHGSRIRHWEAIEVRVRETHADEIYKRKVRDLDVIEEQLDLYRLFLQPLKDPRTGEELIDEKTGLPKLALELPRLDRFVTAYLKLHERGMLLRGDAIHRAEILNQQHVPEPIKERARGPKLERNEQRALVRQLLAAGGGDHAVLDGSVPIRTEQAAGGAEKDAGGGKRKGA